MAKRRLVKSGNTSFTMALPIDWIRKNSFEAGSDIDVSENEEGDLILSNPGIEKSKSAYEIVTIKVDGKEMEEIYMEILIGFVRDNPTIILEGKELEIKSHKIMESLRNFIALDIIEQSDKHIILKNFFILDKETSPKNILKRMDIVNKASFNILSFFFVKGLTQENSFDLLNFSRQNENLHMLVNKAILKLHNSPYMMKSIQTNHLQLLKDNMLAVSLNNISKMLQEISRFFLILDEDAPECAKLKKHFDRVAKRYDGLMASFFTNDYPTIKKFVEKYQREFDRIDEFMKTSDDAMIIQAAGNLKGTLNCLKDVSMNFIL